MSREVTLGIIQADTKIMKVKENVEKGVGLIAEAAKKGANIVVLPELFTTGYNSDILGKHFIDLAETTEGPSISAFREAAKENGVYLQVGYVENRGVPGVVYNSAAFIAPDGSLIDSYAKTHVWAGEKMYFHSGNIIPTYETDFGKVSPSICYDIGFPEYGRIQALKGAELILVSTCYRIQDEDLWRNGCTARALDNLYFVAGSNRVGHEGDLHLIGESRIVGPRGDVIVKAPRDEECILVHTIDLDEVEQARKECLYMLDRRPEIYQAILES